MSFVTVRHFSYTYPNATQPALRDVNLSFERGDFVVVTGKSGCGKSTLGKALSAFLFQDEQPDYTGEIIVNDIPMDRVPLYAASERVAYVQQNPEDQFCTLSVLDEIAFGLENRCVPPNEIDWRIDEALAVVQGTELKTRELATLSGGEKQKVAIASLLVLSPDVLILDEPTSNLDPIATQNVFSALYHLRKTRELTVIIIEHKLSQLVPFTPRWVVMQEGQVAPSDVSSEYKNYLNTLPIQGQRRKGPAASPEAPEPLYTLSDVNLAINGKSILQDINLQIYPGEFISLMGPNGSGKSSLLQTMMGLRPAATGKRMGFGRDQANIKTSELVEEIGFLFQNPDHQLFTQSVWDEATLTLKNLKQLTEKKTEETRAWLARLGLADRLETHPNQLSYGEKRRLNLISVLLHQPRLLLIDEFLIGQDMVNAHTWMSILASYVADGNTVLLVNHHADLSQTYSNRVLFLDAGRLVIDAPPEQAFETISALGFNAFLPEPTGISGDA